MTAAARSFRRPGVIAAALYLGLALYAMRAILPAPASTFPYPLRSPPTWRPIVEADQKLSAANITWNAHTLVTKPWDLYESCQCHPAARAITLGDHQFGSGLLGVVPYLVTKDPILTYNTVAVLVLWIPALTMYAFVFSFTRSASAAFVAGLLFAFHPQRIVDVVHPYVHGNHWTPLALLFTHRLFTRGRWRDAAGLTLFLCLQLLESVYPLLALAALGGTYGVYLSVRNARRLPALAPKLAAALGATACFAAAVLGPYLAARATWGTLAGDTLGGRVTLLYQPGDFGLGGVAYPGSIALVLVSLGLLDRLRGPRRTDGDDPRLAFVVAGLMVFWSAIYGISIPAWGIEVPSLFALAGRVMPGLDALRAGAAIGFGVVLVTAFLAGYGVLALVERRRPAVGALIAGTLAAAAAVEVFYAPFATSSFGETAAMKAYRVRPPAALIELYRKTAVGAVLDVPYGFTPGRFFQMSEDVFLSAFHQHRVGACYNSFKLPLHDDIEGIAERLWRDPGAGDALHALGFGTLVVDELRALRHTKGNYSRMTANPGRLVPLDRAALHTAYRLESSAPVVATFAALAVPAGPTADAVPLVPPIVASAPSATGGGGATAAMKLTVTPPLATIEFRFRNASRATYRHPDPIEPTRVRVRWYRAGDVIRDDEIEMLLPVALAAGEEMTRALGLSVPAAGGEYEVTLAPAGSPDVVVAKRTVSVVAAEPA